MKPLPAAISFLSVMLVICGACDSAWSPEVTRGDLASTLAALANGEWELFDKVQRFTPESLYEQINGRAELYLSYNVISLDHASFDNRHDDRLSISLSVYDMDTPLNAFGIYSVERLPGEAKIDLGRAAYRTNADYYIWHGQYYIRVISVDPGEESRLVGLDWARALVASLSDTGGNVWGYDLLPREDLVQDSVRYFLVDAMGLDFMPETFTAQYDSDGEHLTAFISRSASPAAATGILDQYQGFADRYGDGTEIQTNDGTEFLVCHMGDSFDVVATKGNVFCGVTEVTDSGLAIRQASHLWQALPH